MVSVEITFLDNGIPRETAVFVEANIRSLRSWADQMLRVEDCSSAHLLLSVLNRAVFEQAWHTGYDHATKLDEPALSQHAQPLWQQGYMDGWAAGKSREEAI